MKKKQLKKALQDSKLENERLNSKNKVLVQSIENLIKEAKTLLQSNDSPSKEDLHEAENQATFFDGGEWIPKIWDTVEIISNEHGYHSFEVGEYGNIMKLRAEEYGGIFIIKVGDKEQYLYRSEFKKA